VGASHLSKGDWKKLQVI